ncbi:MAG: DUF222 domain-containing protein [Acidimicrobiaceae bacterium]|nr:DUF222 domain-containing protein [Acidimicrobiaceae bacterium]
MLIDDARQVEAVAKRILAQVDDGSASCEEMREAMPALKSASAMITAAQTSAATSIAGRERHGDGGAEVLATAAGLPIGEARSHIKTAKTLRDLPAVRDAVESGRVTRANAKQLAAAVEKAGSQAVEADGELLAKAESLRPEQFMRVARRWTAEREGDHGASEHARQRARRRVRVWDGDDGMVHLHGEFDAVTGKRVASRLRAEASRMHDADKKNAKANGAGRRSFDQCMADALDYLTAANRSRGAGRSFADICVVAHVDDDTAKLVAELPDGTRLPAEVLDTLTSNAKLTGLIYDRRGKPIWRTESRPTATRAQRQILNARWGGCFHCGTHFAICQPHHIEPVSRGGPTKLDNLVPACWECHNRIHRDGWQIRKCPDGNHTLHPPDRVTYGPACAPEEAALFRPESKPEPDPKQARAGPDATRVGLTAARAILRETQAQRETVGTTA